MYTFGLVNKAKKKRRKKRAKMKRHIVFSSLFACAGLYAYSRQDESSKAEKVQNIKPQIRAHHDRDGAKRKKCKKCKKKCSSHNHNFDLACVDARDSDEDFFHCSRPANHCFPSPACQTCQTCQTCPGNGSGNGAPNISSISPISGPVGTVITINGTNLANVTAVTIGLVPASFSLKSATQITATVPPSLLPSTTQVDVFVFNHCGAGGAGVQKFLVTS